jgi:tetratricopeptide (TPR) repeat protein
MSKKFATILIFFYYCLSVRAQAPAVKICNCLQKLATTQTLSEEKIGTCFEENKPNGSLDGFEDSISVSLITNCDVYFKLMDTLRFSFIRRIDKETVKKSLETLENLPADSVKSSDLINIGICHFVLSNQDSAMTYFDKALAKEAGAPEALYYKAAIFELKGDYKQSMNTLRSITTKREGLPLVIAIVARKQKDK